MRDTVISLFAILGAMSFYAQELHTHNNAASISNESNSVSGWGGSATRTAVSSEFYSGSYSIKLEASSNGWFYSGYSFSSVLDEQYIVQIYAKSDSPEGPGIYWSGVVENQSTPVIGNNWTLYSKTVTATGSTININVYPGTPAVAGNTIYIDHVSITPVNGGTDTQAPTAPNLTTVGHSDTTADLSWSGATDNTAVTGYKIFKDGVLEATLLDVSTYQVTGLTAGTTYSFTATALDAVANESTVSNTVPVTTNASSGGGGSVWSESNSVANYAGDVAIGTSTVPNGYKMAVDGKLITEEVKVQLSGNWPDYVFAKDYKLLSLEEVQKHIREQGHLPNIPSAKEIEANGVELGEMNKLLLEKIEELTLYILKQEKRIETLESTVQNSKN
jgi:hypothetical protein